MSQNSMVVAGGQSGANVRAAVNNALDSLARLSSGPSAPSTGGQPYAYQLWADTTAVVLKLRNAANTAWITLGPLGGLLDSGEGTNVSITHSSTTGTMTTCTVTWDALSVQGPYLAKPGTAPVLNTATAAGNVNALDAGSWATNTWYALHAICNEDGSLVGVLASTSATAPTLPTGYSRFRRIGSLRSTGTATALRCVTQVGGRVTYDMDEDFTPLNGGTATTFTDVTLAAYVPPWVQNARLYAEFGSTSSVDSIVRVIAKGSTVSTGRRLGRAFSTGGCLSAQEATVVTDASQVIQYKVTNTTGTGGLTLAVLGWTDPAL
jgi:hypothetical protein